MEFAEIFTLYNRSNIKSLTNKKAIMKTKKVIQVLGTFIVLLLIGSSLYAKSIVVTGTVTDSNDGQPIAYASVVVKGTTNGVSTDINGAYNITTTTNATLVFSHMGCKSQEIAVNGRTVINISMEQDMVTLDDCVVVAYETISKTIYTGSVSAISAEYSYTQRQQPGYNNEEYSSISENNFKLAVNEPLSTFSADVDAASYSNMRRFINQGRMPEKDAIRVEELVNYFSYDYPQPSNAHPISVTTEVGACPWNELHRLVRIGIKAKEIAGENLPASNLVFLIDVSGSMNGPTRLDLVKSSLKLLVNNLREKDRVAIVVYAGSAGEVLPSTSGSDKQKIKEAIENLSAGGSTAGGAGIQLAYKIAKNNFMKDGNNRVILCTDGDFNVGVSSNAGLESLIEQERKSGVFLTVLGYGMGNYKDSKMQTLAQKGNGNHAYIDNLQEANKVLVEEFGGTIYTIAKDVKLQVEFNPSKVQAYRLVGYETRLLNKEDFNDDTKDAGEMGAGHTVTALYEVVPVGVKSNFVGSVDDLKYQKTENVKVKTNNSPELLTVKVRYKNPNEDVSKKLELPLVDNNNKKLSSDFQFAAAVAMFGQLLRDSNYKGNSSYKKVIELAESGYGIDKLGYRHEFVRLVKAVEGLTK